MNLKSAIKYLMNFTGYILHHNNDSKVIFYHDVGTDDTNMGTPLDIIDAHLQVIKKEGFCIVKNITERKSQIMICFDDGWKGLYDNKEYFIQNGIYPTVFVAVDLIGTEGYMNVEQIKELHSLGFEFEGHTWTHTGLPEHHGEDLRHELLDSKRRLQEMLGFEIHDICFPQGRYSDEAIMICHEVGYKRLYSSSNGSYYTKEGEGLICRNLLQYTPVNQIKYIIKGDSPFYRNRLIKTHYE